MEHNIQLFEHEEFGEVRVVMIDGEPWLVGKDVAKALGYKDHINALKQHVDDEDKRGWQITTPGGTQTATVINESGFYSLVFSSELKSAKKFKRWVTHEVLPSIRKTGSYSVNNNTLANSIELLTNAISKLVAISRDDFAKAQLLRDIASSSRNDVLRDKLIREATKILMGDDFFKKILAKDDELCI